MRLQYHSVLIEHCKHWFQVALILPVGRFMKNSPSVISHHNFCEKSLFRRAWNLYFSLLDVTVDLWVWAGQSLKLVTYSKPSLIQLQLIWMLDNPDWNMKNTIHSWAHNLKDTWHLGRQMNHLFVQKKLDSFFKPTLLCSKWRTISESSVDE
jgi:hypothetical protein